MATRAQLGFYRALWAAACHGQGWTPGTPDAEERRAALHEQLRLPASSTAFNRYHFDTFRAAAEKLAGERAADRNNTEAGERRRLLWRIRTDARTAGFDEAYIVKLAQDINGLGAYQHMAIDDLTNLRNVVHNRMVAKRTARRKMYLDPAKKFPAKTSELTPF